MQNDDLTVQLPLSGHVLQWRPSTTEWRLIATDNLTRRDGSPTELGWEPTVGDTTPHGRGETSPRAGRPDPGETWWLAHGESADGGVAVQVQLADGSHPPVNHAGGVWAAEWVSRPTTATITRGDEVLGVLGFDRAVHH